MVSPQYYFINKLSFKQDYLYYKYNFTLTVSNLFVSVIAGAISYYICRWLDRH